jgi:hypothetical protein
MKRVLVSILALSGFLFPLLAQVDHDYNPNDRIPVVSATIKQDQVPVAVLNAFSTEFDKANPLTWSKFPYALKEYGWVYDVGASDIKLNRYEVTMKTKKGDDLWAAYTADGDLVETREIRQNVALSPTIREKLLNSQYKDWKIIGNTEIIKYYHDNDISKVEQHVRITVEKNNVKRSISFNDQVSK